MEISLSWFKNHEHFTKIRDILHEPLAMIRCFDTQATTVMLPNQYYK